MFLKNWQEKQDNKSENKIISYGKIWLCFTVYVIFHKMTADQWYAVINTNLSSLFNLSRKRLLAVGPDAVSPETQPDGTPSFGVARGYLDRALNGEHLTFEWMHMDSNGEDIPCEVRLSRLPASDKRLVRAAPGGPAIYDEVYVAVLAWPDFARAPDRTWC